MRVLLVCELPGTLSLYSDRLSIGGFEVDRADTALGAIDACTAQDYDLVLLSSSLPEYPAELLGFHVNGFIRNPAKPLRIALFGKSSSGIPVERLFEMGLCGFCRTDDQGLIFESDVEYLLKCAPPRLDDKIMSFDSLSRGAISLQSALRINQTYSVDLERFKDSSGKLGGVIDLMREMISKQSEALIVSLMAAVNSRDAWLLGHNVKVAEMAYEIGERMRFSERELAVIFKASLLHDIGKIGIPDSILYKKGSLTEEEKATIYAHPTIGASIIERNPFFRPYVDIVRYHHERLDGSGYPYRLRGEAIPLEVQIVSVADVFSALTTQRPYRESVAPNLAMAEMLPVSGTRLNADALEVLGEYIHEKKGEVVPSVFSFDANVFPAFLRQFGSEDV
ncbi:MAG: HD domain-containing phosphohydrolase [Candidatus Brocadiia bacterium]